jgi:PAS domain S-box-containing protein
MSVLSERSADKDYLTALLAAQQEASLDGILVVGLDGSILSYNGRFVAIWGLAREVIASRSDELAIKSVLDKLVDPRGFLARVQHLYAHPEETSLDEIELNDGRTLERYSAPVRDDARMFGRIWFFRDITDRKRAERHEQLRERERLQKDFVATVSHELRTPITAIKGFTDTLLAGGITDEKNRLGFVRTIQRNAERLASLVDDLLALAVLETNKRKMSLETVKLASFTRDFIEQISPLTRRSQISVELDIDAALEVKADPSHLSQVLQNLLDNAIKFSPVRGIVRVRGRACGEEAVVSVRDSGQGIPKADLELIFDRFHRARAADHRKVKGTGLGLSIARQIVDMHGGRIWAESSEGAGATLRFTLPLAR